MSWLSKHHWVASNEYAFAVRAQQPISPGHTLIFPRTACTDWLDLIPEVRNAMFRLLDSLRDQLAEVFPEQSAMRIQIDSPAPENIAIHLILQASEQPSPAPVVAQNAGPWSVIGGEKDPFFPVVKNLLKQATVIDIVTAFVQDSGLRLLQPLVFDALRRGAKLRLITSDYLHITQADGLRRLLDWQAQYTALSLPGKLSIRIIEADQRSFHPKSWRFANQQFDLIYVGSANLSFTALCRGVEWNLCADQAHPAHPRLCKAFDELWETGILLHKSWVDQYALQAAQAPQAPLPPGEGEPEVEPPPTPSIIQQEALAALQESRERGHQRALVIMATGLGKTLLAVFDCLAFQAANSPKISILFVVHRHEILRQASSSFRRLLPQARFGWFAGMQEEQEGVVLFASIQKLARHLNLFDEHRFDYIIIDEVHHAAANSYRKLLGHFQPKFLLGLTATPHRPDRQDVVALFDDHIAYQADVVEGIQRQFLCPFQYIGRVDPVDYHPIPWNGHHFDEHMLNAQLTSQARMHKMWQAWQEYPATRTLLFCASIHHADLVGTWLRQQGVRVAVLHSAPHSDPREESIDALQHGQLDAICAVNLFNEGIDIPAVDRLFMLRPTTSSIIFLQQFGRGLRKWTSKKQLTVIDLVGNHKVFLERLGAILSFSPRSSFRDLLNQKRHLSLPEGCTLDIELGVIDVLRQLIPSERNQDIQLFTELTNVHGERPSLTSFFRLGGRPHLLYADLAERQWFAFLHHQKQLSSPYEMVFEKYRSWFSMLEHSPMTRSFKMVAIQALMDASALNTGLQLDAFCRRCLHILQRDPLLRTDISMVSRDYQSWKRYWLNWLSNSWERSEKWLQLQSEKVQLDLRIPPPLYDIFEAMTAELVDYRLQRYRSRQSTNLHGFCTEVTDQYFDAPDQLFIDGKHEITLPNGNIWLFSFAGNRCQMAHPKDKKRNVLPKLLEQWFGTNPSIRRLRFSYFSDGWKITPIGGYVPRFLDRVEILRFDSPQEILSYTKHQIVERKVVFLPRICHESPLLFTFRAPNNQLNRGAFPISKGDWLLAKWCISPDRRQLRNQLVLIEHQHQLSLQQLDHQAQHLGTPIAIVQNHITTAELAPRYWSTIKDMNVASAFGLSEKPKAPWSRIDGHLFLCIEKPGVLQANNCALLPTLKATHAEQAHVLLRSDTNAPWRYAGIAENNDFFWYFPSIDQQLYHSLLDATPSPPKAPSKWMEEARTFVAKHQQKRWLGKKCRILGRTRQGGLRIDGGKKGFAARTISLQLLAWSLYARNEANQLQVPLQVEMILLLRGQHLADISAQNRKNYQWARFLVLYLNEQKIPKSIDYTQRLTKILQKHKIAYKLADKHEVVDIYIPQGKIAISVLSCPWMSEQKSAQLPSYNRQFWLTKQQQYQYYIHEQLAVLPQQGWTVLQVWEHEIKPHKTTLLKRIQEVQREKKFGKN